MQSPNSKVHGANMGPIWGRQDLGGPHVDPMNLAIWVSMMDVLRVWWFAEAMLDRRGKIPVEYQQRKYNKITILSSNTTFCKSKLAVIYHTYTACIMCKSQQNKVW